MCQRVSPLFPARHLDVGSPGYAVCTPRRRWGVHGTTSGKRNGMDRNRQVNPYGVTIDDAPAFWLADILFVLLASGEQTGGRCCLPWGVRPQGSGPTPHTQ